MSSGIAIDYCSPEKRTKLGGEKAAEKAKAAPEMCHVPIQPTPMNRPKSSV